MLAFYLSFEVWLSLGKMFTFNILSDRSFSRLSVGSENKDVLSHRIIKFRVIQTIRETYHKDLGPFIYLLTFRHVLFPWTI